MRTNTGIQIAVLRLEWLRRIIDGFDDGGVQSKSIGCSFSLLYFQITATLQPICSGNCSVEWFVRSVIGP